MFVSAAQLIVLIWGNDLLLEPAPSGQLRNCTVSVSLVGLIFQLDLTAQIKIWPHGGATGGVRGCSESAGLTFWIQIQILSCLEIKVVDPQCNTAVLKSWCKHEKQRFFPDGFGPIRTRRSCDVITQLSHTTSVYLLWLLAESLFKLSQQTGTGAELKANE